MQIKQPRATRASKDKAKTHAFTWGDFDKMLKKAISTPPIPPSRKPSPKSA
jgi:hypothetical protein